jgi:hypothetical protein
MQPLAIVISFDVDEQVMPGSIPGWITSLVHEFGFDRAKAAFHWSVIPTISFPAHGLGHAGCGEKFAVIGGGVLAAAIGMMDQARRRFLPLDGHGQGRDSQFRPHVIAHRPAGDLPCEKVEHDGQIEPSFPGWHIGYIGEPDLVGLPGGKVLSQPVSRVRLAALPGLSGRPRQA